MNRLLFVMACLCCYINAFAQTGSIQGIVTNESGNGIAHAAIYIPILNKGTSTDGSGFFRLSNVTPGSYAVTISYLGYQSVTQNIEVQAGQSSTLNTILTQGTLQLSDVVITSSSINELNSISQVDIQLRPTNTSQEILRMVPGLFIAQHAGGGKAEQIFLRGFDIDHGTDISLEVDGLPVNMVSHAHGQGYSDLHFLIPELVSTVDFNKGPYEAEKGNFTTAGYVSFNTKNTLDNNLVKVEGGRFGTFRNVNAINLIDDPEKKQSAYIASEYFRTDGYFESNQNFNRLNLSGKFNQRLDNGGSFTLGLSTFNSRWDASGQVPQRAIDNGSITRFGAIDDTEGGETSRSNAFIRYNKQFDNGGMFENQFYYSKYDFYLVSNFTFFLNDPVNGDQITQKESRNIYGYRAKYTHEYSLGNASLSSEIGGGFRYDDVNDINLYKTISRKTFVSDMAKGDIDETNLFAYINETLTLSKQLSVNASVRLDHFTFNYIDALNPIYERQSVSKAVVSPKVQLRYNVNNNVELYAKSGIGFHSNDTRVVVAQQGKTILPKAYGADLGSTFRVGQKLIANAAVWMLDLEQEFVYVGDEGIVEPSGETRRQGVDLSLRYQLGQWLFADADVNWTKPVAKSEPEGADYIPLAPTFTSIGGLSFRLKNGLNGSLRYRYLDDRAANEDNSVIAEGYFLMDAVLKYTRKNWELSFVAENILDQEWNEAQFDTESRLINEAEPVSEIHFTPGTPFFFKAGISFMF